MTIRTLPWAVLLAAVSQGSLAAQARERLSINEGWRIQKGDPPMASWASS